MRVCLSADNRSTTQRVAVRSHAVQLGVAGEEELRRSSGILSISFSLEA